MGSYKISEILRLQFQYVVITQRLCGSYCSIDSRWPNFLVSFDFDITSHPDLCDSLLNCFHLLQQQSQLEGWQHLVTRVTSRSLVSIVLPRTVVSPPGESSSQCNGVSTFMLNQTENPYEGWDCMCFWRSILNYLNLNNRKPKLYQKRNTKIYDDTKANANIRKK